MAKVDIFMHSSIRRRNVPRYCIQAPLPCSVFCIDTPRFSLRGMLFLLSPPQKTGYGHPRRPVLDVGWSVWFSEADVECSSCGWCSVHRGICLRPCYAAQRPIHRATTQIGPSDQCEFKTLKPGGLSPRIFVCVCVCVCVIFTLRKWLYPHYLCLITFEAEKQKNRKEKKKKQLNHPNTKWRKWKINWPERRCFCFWLLMDTWPENEYQWT